MSLKPLIRVVHITTIDMSLRYLLLNQLVSLRDEGYEVTGISTLGNDVSALESAGITHIPVHISRRIAPLSDLHSLYRLWRAMRNKGFIIVHTHNPKPGLLGQLAARLALVPIVVNTLHGFYFNDNMSPHERRFYIWMEKIAAMCSDVILSQNSEDIETAIQEGICRPDKIKFLGNGIDLGRFDPNLYDKAVLDKKRKHLGLSDTGPIIGFVGRLVAEKGILELLKAMKHVQEQVPNVQLLIVGPLDLEKGDSLSPSIADDYGVQDFTIFAGMRNDMPEMYQLMDVFVLPSHREGYPRAPMEASAMAVPCIVTNIRGCREVVRNDVNGLLVELGNADQLADAIIKLLKNPDLARQLGQAGHQIAAERFDEQDVFDKVKREYLRLLHEKELI